MWGNGVSDEETIPSQFNKLTNSKVYNFGESSWNSRQSLNQLINLIGDGNIPSKVIFYDGVNDVFHSCRSDITKLASFEHESFIREKVSSFWNENIYSEIFKYVAKKYALIFKKFNLLSINEQNYYDCDTNLRKSKNIAKHLVTNWCTAYLISKEKNAEFLAILQPNLYTSNVKFDYFDSNDLKLVEEFRDQFKAVYPEILLEMQKICDNDHDFCKVLIDGTDWLIGQENIFIDLCHINGKGNKIIANQIATHEIIDKK